MTIPPSGHVSPLKSFDTNVAQGAEYRGELLLNTGPGLLPARLQQQLITMGCPKIRQLGRLPYWQARCLSVEPMRPRITALERSPDVIWVEPGYVEILEEAPDDLSIYQWHHHNVGQRIQDIDGISGADLDSLQAWMDTQPKEGPVIAIIDMGVHANHEDLAGQMAHNTHEVCNNDVDDDDNGYVDDCYGWDFGDNDADPTPLTLPASKPSGSTCRSWHGTGIASLAGAIGNNGRGVAGVHWQAKFLNLKKYPDESCISTTTQSIEAIGYALAQQADILILAFSSSAYSLAYQELLREANEQGVFVVMSAGNGTRDVDESIRFPNNYDITYRVTVANSDPTDRLWETSNWGATRVDLAAPGTHLLMAGIESEDFYHARTGTSYSTGLAAGALSLAMANYPMLSSEDIYQALFEGLTPLEHLDCGSHERCVKGSGRLNTTGLLAAASLRAGPPDLRIQARFIETDVTPRDYQFEPGDEVGLILSVRNPGPSPVHGVTLTMLVPAERSHEFELPSGSFELGDIPVDTQRSWQLEQALQVTTACTRDGRASVGLRLSYREGQTDAEATLEYHCDLDSDGDGFGRDRDCNDADPRYYPGAEREAYNCGIPAAGGCQSLNHATWAWLLLSTLLIIRCKRPVVS